MRLARKTLVLGSEALARDWELNSRNEYLGRYERNRTAHRELVTVLLTVMGRALLPVRLALAGPVVMMSMFVAVLVAVRDRHLDRLAKRIRCIRECERSGISAEEDENQKSVHEVIVQ